jgi:hypothetical protein
MRKTLLIAVGLLMTQLSGCWQSALYHEDLIGPYRLSAIDLSEQMSICYAADDQDTCHERISETVFSVGWNERFIVAKQHPSNDKSVTNYFILDMSKDKKNLNASVSVMGPFSESEYKKQSLSMVLPKFSRTMDDLK